MAPALLDMEPPPQPPSEEPIFSVIHQEVELDIDFLTREVTGRTELMIEPHSKDLRVIKLSSRGVVVKNITAGETNQFPVTSVRYRDPYETLRVRDSYGVHQHHLIRENFEEAIKVPPEPNLVITLPKQVKVQQYAMDLDSAKGQGANGKADGTVEIPLPKTAEDTEGMFAPITIRMDFEVVDTRHAFQWVGLRPGDSRFPHVYTTASAVPGSYPSFAFPCVEGKSRCSWKLTITCPRTLGDIRRRPRQATTQTNGTAEAQTNGVSSSEPIDTEMLDADSQSEDNPFSLKIDDEEKDKELLVVCSGFLEDNDMPLDNDRSRRKWQFHCETPVAAHHIGFAIGPFERVNLTEFRESEVEEQLKQHAVNVYGFCLPGRSAEVRNIGMPLTMAIDHFCQQYSQYPFESKSLSHKLCFVDDLATDALDTATLSVCSSRHLIPESVTDKVYESSRVLIRAIASQWIGIHITPKFPKDYWIIVGGSYFMTDHFMQTVWGKNEYRYRQHLAAKKVLEMDVDRPSLTELGENLHVDRFELEFMMLKAPLVLFILHQRLIKKNGSHGVPRLLFRMFTDVKSGRLVNGEIDTDRLAYSTEKVAHGQIRSFYEQWVYNAGCPSFHVTQRFNKKKMVIEVTITQKQGQEIGVSQKLNAGNFMREAKEHEHEVYAGAVQPLFTGPMTIRVHEADGTPYEHTAEIDKVVTKFDIPYTTKYKRLKRSKLQKEREAAAEGLAADDADGDVLTYCLGDCLQSERDVKNWRLTDWSKDEEQSMNNEFFEWLRMDKDFEWICKMDLEQPAHMYISQLQQDNDVVAHMQAAEWLQSRSATSIISTVFVRTVMDDRYFYGVRTMAAHALARCAVPELKYLGQFHLLKAFETLFCFADSPMTRSNDFTDQRLYSLQCAIPLALAGVRDTRGKAPSDVKKFFLDKLKFNDNSSNAFSDNYYVGTLLHCLAESMVEPPGIEFADLTEEAEEISFRREALNEIERHRRIDEWIPSYRNLYTRAAIHCQKRLIESKVVPRRMAGFMQYLRPGNLHEVRIAAFEALIDLGMLGNSPFVRTAIHMFSTESSPFMREHLWAALERGLGLIALADSDVPTQAASDGLTIAETESVEARAEKIRRTESIEGALSSIQERLGRNEVLQESLLEALKSPFIGLKDFAELLNACHILYAPVEKLLITLRYPRFWKVEHLGNAKILFSHLRYRTKSYKEDVSWKQKIDADIKALKRKSSAAVRSESPAAKRRRTSVALSNPPLAPVAQPATQTQPSTKIVLKARPATAKAKVEQLPSSKVELKPQPQPQLSLPSPTSSQPPVAPNGPACKIKREPSSASLIPSTGRKPIVLKFNTNKAKFVALVEENIASLVTSVERPPTPAAASSKSTSSPARPVSRASSRRSRTKSIVASPAAMSPPALPASPAATAMSPPPPPVSAPLPQADAPKPPQKLKIKLKLGGGGVGSQAKS